MRVKDMKVEEFDYRIKKIVRDATKLSIDSEMEHKLLNGTLRELIRTEVDSAIENKLLNGTLRNLVVEAVDLSFQKRVSRDKESNR